jgi:predicted MPP superfamily phosphohydrolase
VTTPPTDAPAAPRAPTLTRRAFLGAGTAGLLGAAGAAVGGRWNSLDVVRTAPPDGVGARPIRIALVTDLHAPHNYVAIDEIADAVNAFAPHLVLVVGDAIDQRGEEPRLRAFDALPASHGKFAALGNHEYWSGCPMSAIRREYERADVRLLVNADASVEIDGRLVHIAGLDDWRAGRPDYSLVADARPGWRDADRRIVLAHCPASFGAIGSAGTLAADVFGGHTHGGQVAPGGLALFLPPGSGGYVRGWYPGPRAGQRLYVSRGIGNSGVPFRLGARPELALVTL